MKKKIIILCSLLLTFVGCSRQYIQVQTQYLSRDTLASSFVETPDPLRQTNYIGQRLLIQWCTTCRSPLSLHLYLLMRNHEEKQIIVPSIKSHGTAVYDLTSDDYCRCNGILSYYIEIVSGSEVIESWKHPLWVNTIELNESEA